MKRILCLLCLLAVLLLFFACGKASFMLYNRDIHPFSMSDAFLVWRHGLTMDISVACYVLSLPVLAFLASVWWKSMPLRRLLRPYWLLVTFVLVACVTADILLYEFWKFKINALVFAYLTSPTEAVASVSVGYVVSRLALGMLAIAVLAFVLISLTPCHLVDSSHRIRKTLILLFVSGLTFVGIRGGVGLSNMNVGKAYFSQTLFLNHAAVNPVFSLLSSLKRTERFAENFNYLSEKERADIFSELFPIDTEVPSDTLLCIQRPNVLIVLMEGFGNVFVEKQGVAPELCRLISEGIFWDNYYSNSFRTDRGTVSAYSGWISYPTTSLMRLPSKVANTPSIARSLAQEGYATSYLYGGDIDFMDMKGYLVGSGYERLVSDADFSYREAHESKWGVNDSITSRCCYEMVAAMPSDRPWHLAYQTLSSHEPWKVPFDKFEDEKLNAFAFTDHCIGQLIDSLKILPQWENLLVILLPDHGVPYQMTYENPEYFHSPMLWLGGAIREPRKISTLMGQNDLAATLLSQMGISHCQYPWSRNVLSDNYTQPFVYCTFPSGIMFKDETGVSIYDITANSLILDHPASPERLLKAKSLLQTSYDLLEKM